MPNGGSDNCGECRHNRANHERPDLRENHFAEFCMKSYCTLRDLDVSGNPFWTYCANFTHTSDPWGRARDPQRIEGSVYSQGCPGDGYARIPWHRNSAPRVPVSTKCCICGRNAKEGIEIIHNGETLGFCTNQHYVQWWKHIKASH